MDWKKSRADFNAGVVCINDFVSCLCDDDRSYYQGLHFLFMPDFSKLTSRLVLTAMGHAFFTLSLAWGQLWCTALICLKAYPCQNGVFNCWC